MVYDDGMLIADNRNLFVCFLGELLLGGGGGGLTYVGARRIGCLVAFICQRTLKTRELILIHYTFLAFLAFSAGPKMS